MVNKKSIIILTIITIILIPSMSFWASLPQILVTSSPED